MSISVKSLYNQLTSSGKPSYHFSIKFIIFFKSKSLDIISYYHLQPNPNITPVGYLFLLPKALSY